MKSIFITFLMFILLFGLLKLNVTTIFDGFWFPIISLIILAVIIAIAVSMFGLPTKENFKEALKLKEKEVKDEKDN